MQELKLNVLPGEAGTLYNLSWKIVLLLVSLQAEKERNVQLSESLFKGNNFTTLKYTVTCEHVPLKPV